MAVCDVCGVEYDYPGEKVNLYSAKLIERKVSGRKMNTRTISSQYSQVRPVTMTICKRHRRELVTQRIMPGVIVFVVLMLPVMFLVSRFYNFQGSDRIILYIISVVISLFLMSRVIRLISLDGLVATALTIRDKRKGLGVEYLTYKKYNRFTNPPKPGLRGIFGSLRSGPDTKEDPGRPQKSTSKRK